MVYTIYGDELSLFTRKLECACLFAGVAFERREKTPENAALLEQRAGTHQVPLLETPEHWVLSDSTPVMAFLDARHPGHEMFPAGFDGVLVHLLEEYFDEWVSRVMVHFRWHYPDSAAFAATRMSRGDVALADKLKDWGKRACRATGTETPGQQQAAEEEYLALMTAADRQLRDTPYLLGERPTALDCCVLGGLRAHTLMDPDPRPRLAHLSTLLEWNAERAMATLPGAPWPPVCELTPFAHEVLSRYAGTLQAFMLANRAARAAGEKLFTITCFDEPMSCLARAYPVTSHGMLAARIAALEPPSRARVDDLLANYDLSACFA